MIQAIKDSKWYWYIPIVGILFISEITDWIFEPKTVQDRHNRNLVWIYSSMIVNLPVCLLILKKFLIK